MSFDRTPPPGAQDGDCLDELELAYIRERRRGEPVPAATFVLDRLAVAREAEQRLRAAAVLLDEGPAAPDDAAGLPDEGQPANDPLSVGRFDVVDRLGEGAFGVVYWAYDPKYARDVALKVLRVAPRHAEADGARKAARIAARLQHTNIVAFYESGEADGRHYLVGQLVAGESLEDRLRREGRLAPAVAAELAHKIALALDYAHGQGIIHRDVKPSNILLDPAGEPLLTDFDLALCPAIDDAAAFVGALHYMSPEQLAGQSATADARSDVYALGVVLYRMLTGRLPIEAPSAAEQLAQIERPDFPQACALPADVKSDLAAICRQALQADPQKRFDSAGAMAKELWRCLNDEPLTIRRQTFWEAARRWLRRNRARAVVTAAVLGLIIAGGVGSAYAYHVGTVAAAEAHGEEIVAEQQRTADAKLHAAEARVREITQAESRCEVEVRALLDRARQRLASPTLGKRLEAQALLRGAGQPLAAIGRPDLRRKLLDELRSVFASTLSSHDVKPQAKQDATPLPGHWAGVWPAALHPDGKSMAIGLPSGPVYWRRGAKAFLPDLSTIDNEPHRRPTLAYSPDGEHLAFSTRDGAVSVHDREATRLRQLTTAGKAETTALGFGRGGKLLRVFGADGLVRSWTLPDFQELPSRQAVSRPVMAAAFSADGDTLAVADQWADRKGRVSLIDLRSGKATELVRLNDGVRKLAWSPDARLIAIAEWSGIVRLWETNGTPSHRLGPLVLAANALVFSPDGRWLLASPKPGGSPVWDVATGEQVLGLSDAPLGFSRDGTTLALSGTAGVYFRDLLPPEHLVRLTGHWSAVVGVTWSADSRRFATIDNRFEVRVWEAGARPRLLRALRAPVPTNGFFAHNAGLALSEDGRLLAYASGGWQVSELRIWDVQTGDEVSQWSWSRPAFERLTSLGGGKFLLVRELLDATGNVHTALYELGAGGQRRATGFLRRSQPGDRFSYLEGMPTEDGRFYCWSGPREGASHRVEVWDLKSRKLVRGVSLKHETHGTLSPDGRRLWVEQDRVLWEYDVPGVGPPRRVDRVPAALSRRGGWAAYAGKLGWRDDPVLSLCREGKPVLDLPHDGANARPVFSPDGRRLVFGTDSGTVWFADLAGVVAEVDRFAKSLPGD